MPKVIMGATNKVQSKGPMTSQPVIKGTPMNTMIMAATNNTRGRINKDPVGMPISSPKAKR